MSGKLVWVPEGWRVVPEEPTIEQVDAAFVWRLDREKLRAAIEAAPDPPPPPPELLDPERQLAEAR